MKILIIAGYNKNSYAPFIIEQVDALKQLGFEIEYFGVRGKGMQGYLSNLNPMKDKITDYQPDLIHAHYGLSGLLANLQRSIPVVTTYHGSDIHSGGKSLFLSKQSIRLSAFNIFVSDWLLKQSGYRGNRQRIIPCGIDTVVFCPIERSEARKSLGWSLDKKYVLFSGAYDIEVKNSPLAKKAVEMVEGVQLIELNGYTREQVNLIMNAADCLLLTSFREGSPQVIKEALACGTPIVSVGVADVEKLTSGIDGCYITNYDATEIAEKIRLALTFQGKTNGRSRIFEYNLSNDYIAKQVAEVYELALKNNTK